ncbi:maltotransferase domain-containing protein [Antarcticibacterium sp. 1MA-6-2]|uniref:maltotransferase domain-containing protein n=1 Tax=Antarcticibacterium sp. 1MA-6-2 TaxID=2908210 RepID=UPI0021057D28|nr:maltotransferase domain-containing protein [Antarcticibacterium sp. 1MA-6-2]
MEAWVDHFATWQYGLKKKYDDRQPIKTELLIGAQMMEEAIARASAPQKKKLQSWIEELRKDENDKRSVELALNEEVTEVMYQNRDRTKAH